MQVSTPFSVTPQPGHKVGVVESMNESGRLNSGIVRPLPTMDTVGWAQLSRWTGQRGVNAQRIVIIAVLLLAIGGFCYLKILRDERVAQWQIICLHHLREITDAKEALVREKNLKPGVVSVETLAGYLERGMPECPAGGKYVINRIGTNPTCSIPSHSMFQPPLPN
jgi:hypothetical protein